MAADKTPKGVFEGLIYDEIEGKILTDGVQLVVAAHHAAARDKLVHETEQYDPDNAHHIVVVRPFGG